MTKPVKQTKSVPTIELNPWIAEGWFHIMPDFDKPGHSIVGMESDAQVSHETNHEQETP